MHKTSDRIFIDSHVWPKKAADNIIGPVSGRCDHESEVAVFRDFAKVGNKFTHGFFTFQLKDPTSRDLGSMNDLCQIAQS